MSSGLLPRIEAGLIILMILGCVLIAQTFSFTAYRVGLLALVGATLLNIAVGNVPRSARGWRAFRIFFIILLVTAAIFVIGIILVPYMAQLGR